jgi:hypothetical protein
MSVHENEPKIADAIWNGDYWGPGGALARHKALYDASPKDAEARIPWMSTLYSALGSVRANGAPLPLSLRRTAWCVANLLPQVGHFTFLADDEPAVYALSAEQCDVVSSVLLKWSAIPILGFRTHLDAALRYATSAYLKRDVHDTEGHTHALVALTLARIYIRTGEPDVAKPFLDEAKRAAPNVADANQRSRIYRGYAELIAVATSYSKFGIGAALDALDAADNVPGIARDVRAKNGAIRAMIAKRC